MLKACLGQFGTRLIPLLAGVGLAFLTACGSPNLVPRVRPYRLPAMIHESSVILIGQVSATKLTGRVTPTQDEQKWRLALVEVEVNVENVLKGRLGGPKIEFYYYYPAGPFSLPSVNIINTGDRAVFFLVQDKGVHRAIQDVFASSIHVATGSHPELLSAPQKSVEEAIAAACVLPGPRGDLDRQRWPYEILPGAQVSEALVGRRQTLEWLESLLHSQDYRVSIEACFAVAALSSSKAPCVDRMPAEKGLDVEFDFHVRQQLYALQARYDRELGKLAPVRLPPQPPPGIPRVKVAMKEVRVFGW